MKRALLHASLAVLLAVGASCAHSAPPTAGGASSGDDAAAIRALVDESVRAADRKDVAWFTSHTAHDPDAVFFGTDAAEVWVGWDALRASIEKQFAAAGETRTSIRDVRVKVGPSRDAAWASYLVDYEGTSMGERFSLKGVRTTQVFEKRDGRWLTVSSHSSVPVAGQAVRY